MPIKPENRDRYPKNWPEIRERIRQRSGGRCECKGECGLPHPLGRCVNTNGDPSCLTGRRVTLTVGHRDHTPENCRDDNLAHWCNGCHLRYDVDHHRQTARETRRAKLKNLELFDV